MMSMFLLFRKSCFLPTGTCSKPSTARPFICIHLTSCFKRPSQFVDRVCVTLITVQIPHFIVLASEIWLHSLSVSPDHLDNPLVDNLCAGLTAAVSCPIELCWMSLYNPDLYNDFNQYDVCTITTGVMAKAAKIRPQVVINQIYPLSAWH